MPRPSRTRNSGRSYDKRPVAGNPTPQALEVDGLSSSDARALAAEIKEQHTRWRVSAIRLLGNRACCLVIQDSVSGTEHQLGSAADWQRLIAADEGDAGPEPEAVRAAG
ncbi:MAG: hypothetical protein QOJ13_1865 [Gaiellales bacterium]|jgi:hypothetical protein|nr:hypothetical protein [Gaiellales bacterium]MDX6592669.1 hypothetical protein [Gaiellales bacterium]